MERKETGGAKEFRYTKEHLDRIRNTDTEATKRFKEAYSKWQEQQLQEQQEEREFKQRERTMLALVVMLLVFVFILLFMRFH